MEYPELILSCKIAIEKGRCGGCPALEDFKFRGNPNCRFGRIPTARESIERIHRNLGVDKNARK